MFKPTVDMGAMTVYRLQYILPLIRVDSHVVAKQRRLQYLLPLIRVDSDLVAKQRRLQYILPLIRVDSHVVAKQRRLVEKFAVLEYYTVSYIQYSMYMRDEFNKINL